MKPSEAASLEAWTVAGNSRAARIDALATLLGLDATSVAWDVAVLGMLQMAQQGQESFAGVIICPGCAELTEVHIDQFSPETLDVNLEGAAVALRPPTVAEMAHAASRGPAAADYLAEQMGANELSERDREAALAALDSAHPFLAPLALTECVGCGLALSAPIDPVDCAWAVVTQQAKSLIADVAVLARAYGWSEADTFAIPASRRRLYVQLAGVSR